MTASVIGDVVLIGAMASGKTTLGRLLAGRLGRPFLDSDQQLLERAGRTAKEIAGSEGIEALHRMEREALFAAIDGPGPVVVAAAASVIEDEGVRDALDGCFCVWLTAGDEAIVRRIDEEAHRRSVGPEEGLSRRLRWYEEAADVVVDTGASTPERSLEVVLTAIAAAAT